MIENLNHSLIPSSSSVLTTRNTLISVMFSLYRFSDFSKNRWLMNYLPYFCRINYLEIKLWVEVRNIKIKSK